MGLQSVTMDDIAKLANVSKSTVSRVLNDKNVVNGKTRKAVLDAMAELRFRPNHFARGLASGRSMTVGIVTQDVGSPYFDSVTNGVIQGFGGSDYSPIFMGAGWDSEKELQVIQTLVGRQVDGLILIGGRLSEELSVSPEMPLIYIGSDSPERVTISISVDNFQPAYDATCHLIECGHSSIAYIRGPENQRDAVSRYEGFCKAMRDHGFEPDQDLVLTSDFSAQSGTLAMNALLMRGKPFTAVFCANDRVAFGARQTLFRQKLRVPEDVSLVGFDDQSEAAYMAPPLTTVHQPTVEMGRVAALAMVELIGGKQVEVPKLEATLVKRESVSRYRQFT